MENKFIQEINALFKNAEYELVVQKCEDFFSNINKDLVSIENISVVYQNLAFSNYMLGEYANSLNTISKAESHSDILPDTMIKLFNLRGVTLMQQNKTNDALNSFMLSRRLCFENNYQNLLTANYVNTAKCFHYNGESFKAIKDFKKSIEINDNEKNKNYDHLVSAYIGIGVVFNDLQQNKKAYNYYKKALKSTENINNKYVIAHAYHKTALCAPKKLKSNLFLSAIENAKSVKSKKLLIQIYCDYSIYLLKNKKVEEAKKNLAICNTLRQKEGFDIGVEFSYDFAKVQLLIYEKDYTTAIEILLKIEALIHEWSWKQLLAKTYKYLSKTHEELNNTKEAYKYLRLYVRENKKNVNNVSLKNINFIDQKLKTKEKELEIVYLKEKKLVLEQKNFELDTFAGRVSHDLRSSIRNINTFLNLMEDQLSEEVFETNKDFLSQLHSNLEQMNLFIISLLNYSKSTFNKNEIKEVDLNEVIKIVKSNLLFQIKETNTQILYKKLPSVNATQTSMTILFQNLIENAMKYRNNEVDPIIEIKSKKNKNYLQVEVKDNGIGISEKDSEKVFNFLYQISTSKSGFGMGLSICKKIVETLDGFIEVKSNMGKGTSFIINYRL